MYVCVCVGGWDSPSPLIHNAPIHVPWIRTVPGVLTLTSFLLVFQKLDSLKHGLLCMELPSRGSYSHWTLR